MAPHGLLRDEPSRLVSLFDKLSFTCSSSSLSSSSPSCHRYRFFSPSSLRVPVLGFWFLVMEGKKGTAGSSSSSIAEELFGRKEAAGILGAVFQPPASGVARVGKEPQTSDLLESSKKQATESQTWNAQSATADAKTQGSPSKGQTAPYKDRFCGEAVDTSSLGSSLYYGGPDICSNFSPSQTYGSQFPPKKNDEDDPEDSNMASRGNWWQGSLYY